MKRIVVNMIGMRLMIYKIVNPMIGSGYFGVQVNKIKEVLE